MRRRGCNYPLHETQRDACHLVVIRYVHTIFLHYLPPDVHRQHEAEDLLRMHATLRWTHQPYERREVTNRQLMSRIDALELSMLRLNRQLQNEVCRNQPRCEAALGRGAQAPTEEEATEEESQPPPREVQPQRRKSTQEHKDQPPPKRGKHWSNRRSNGHEADRGDFSVHFIHFSASEASTTSPWMIAVLTQYVRLTQWLRIAWHAHRSRLLFFWLGKLFALAIGRFWDFVRYPLDQVYRC